MTQHTNIADLDWTQGLLHEYAVITLDTYDTAENPAAEGRVLHGPAVIKYTRRRDGALDACVLTRKHNPTDTV